MHVNLSTLEDTERLAARIAARAVAGDFIGLTGPLGAGKTAFARAFLTAVAGLQRAPAPAEVPSPTFTLVQTYEIGGVEVAHFDLYRIRTPEEAAELGLDEARARGIVLVEWPERLGDRLPRDRLDIALSLSASEQRAATLTQRGTWRTRGL
jgi:tRNA threonylcarbamoyladenosine biosynthesis protein TsaE